VTASARSAELAKRLRLTVLTSPKPACGRRLEAVVAECVAAGATTIQLRDKNASARDLADQARELLVITRSAGALLIINDRADVALAVGADGVHLGPDDIPVRAARDIAPNGFLIGYSTDDPERAREAAGEGADYLGVGAVYGTSSKPGLENESIGPAGVRAVVTASGLPCVGIGGITPENATAVIDSEAGIAVLSVVMASPAPAEVVNILAGLFSPN